MIVRLIENATGESTWERTLSDDESIDPRDYVSEIESNFGVNLETSENTPTGLGTYSLVVRDPDMPEIAVWDSVEVYVDGEDP